MGKLHLFYFLARVPSGGRWFNAIARKKNMRKYCSLATRKRATEKSGSQVGFEAKTSLIYQMQTLDFSVVLSPLVRQLFVCVYLQMNKVASLSFRLYNLSTLAKTKSVRWEPFLFIVVCVLKIDYPVICISCHLCPLNFRFKVWMN